MVSIILAIHYGRDKIANQRFITNNSTNQRFTVKVSTNSVSCTLWKEMVGQKFISN